MLAALVLLVVIAAALARALPPLLSLEAELRLIKDRNIAAGALYYTEVEQLPMLESLVGAALRREAGRLGFLACGVATLELNRPERMNTLAPPFFGALRASAQMAAEEARTLPT